LNTIFSKCIDIYFKISISKLQRKIKGKIDKKRPAKNRPYQTKRSAHKLTLLPNNEQLSAWGRQITLPVVGLGKTIGQVLGEFRYARYNAPMKDVVHIDREVKGSPSAKLKPLTDNIDGLSQKQFEPTVQPFNGRRLEKGPIDLPSSIIPRQISRNPFQISGHSHHPLQPRIMPEIDRGNSLQTKAMKPLSDKLLTL
jgi:hypothetical protein